MGTSLADSAPQRVQRTERGLLLTLRGWTHEDNIASDDAVSEALVELLSSTSGELTLDKAYPFLSRYDFEEWMSGDGFQNYIFYSSAMGDPSPGPELLLFFYQGRFSFLLHKKPIHSPHISEQRRVAGVIVSCVDEPARSARQAFEAHCVPLIRQAD
jgi:hypothetical protein